MSRTRTGKIARLAKKWRDIIDLMLEDGASYDQIRAAVKEAIPPEQLNDQNIQHWREGGHEDWLNERRRLDDMRAKREFALQLVKENEGSQVHEAGLQIAATQIYELLQDFDVETLKEKLAGDPGNFARIVNAMAKLSDSGLKFERYHAEVQAAKARIENELAGAKSKGGVTTETIERIERELNLL